MIIGSILDILALAEKYLQHPPQYCLFHVHVLPSLFQSVRRKEYVQKRAPASPSQTTVGQTAEVEVTQPETTTGASSSVDSGFELWTDYLDAETAAALDPQCVVSDLQWTTVQPRR